MKFAKAFFVLVVMFGFFDQILASYFNDDFSIGVPFNDQQMSHDASSEDPSYFNREK